MLPLPFSLGFRMKIFQLALLSLVAINGLLTVNGARLKCPSVNITNGNAKIRSKGRLIVYKCNRGFYMLGEAFAACIKGKWDSHPPICIRPGCSAIRYMLNGHIHDSWRSSLLRFTCDSGYKLVGPSYIYCNGRRWNAMQPYCKAVDIRCNFENRTTCNWEIDDYDDEDFNWRLQQHEPPSRVLRTGPLHDHTLTPNDTGHYLVLETSDYTPSSRPARIHSPVFPQPSDNSSCFIFWYHMYGNTIGTLNVFLNNALAFQRRGNHGDRWIKGIVSLSENISTSELQLIIEGSYGGGYTGDIGLDDFSIENGTECLASTVTSCAGRCYEDHVDESFCLCNPQCLTDSSCCKDFMEVCSLESTTTYIEASTGVEDSTQVYSNTAGTSVSEYDTNLSETPINTSESETTDVTECQYSTDSEALTSIDDYNSKFIKLNSTQSGIEEYKYSTSYKNIFSSSAANYSAYLSNVFFSSLEIERQATKPTKETSTTHNILSSTDGIFSLLNLDATKHSTLINYNRNVTESTTHDTTTGTTVKQFLQPLKASSTEGTTMTLNLKKSVAELSYNSNVTITPYTVKEMFTKSSTHHTLPTSNNSAITGRTTVVVPLSTTELTFKNLSLNKNATVYKGVNQNSPTSVLVSSTVLQTTSTPNLTFKFVTINKTFTTFIGKTSKAPLTSKSIPLSSSTEVAFKTFGSISPSFKNKTFSFYNISKIIPHFRYLVTSTPKQTNSTVNKSNNDVNNSHTHLQSTSLLPSLIHTTAKESDLVTTIETSTTQIKHFTVSPTKWRSIYKPKDRFMFSAVQRNESSVNKTFIIISVCTVGIVVISALVVVFLFRRRRFRFVNELEEADTDILYHSSQEMLDLHIARPHH